MLPNQDTVIGLNHLRACYGLRSPGIERSSLNVQQCCWQEKGKIDFVYISLSELIFITSCKALFE